MITIKDLFEYWDVTREDVCKSLNIPYRTLQNWLCGYRKCPEYVILLLDEWMSNHCYPKKLDIDFCYKAYKHYSKISKLWKEKFGEQYDIELSKNE